MSTPIESNTEGLQEILQTVYNLPMAGGGGGEYDLTIPVNIMSWQSIKKSDIGAFDQNEVLNVIAKLSNVEDVRVNITGVIALDSGDPYPIKMTPTAVNFSGNGLEIWFFTPKDAGDGMGYCRISFDSDGTLGNTYYYRFSTT